MCVAHCQVTADGVFVCHLPDNLITVWRTGVGFTERVERRYFSVKTGSKLIPVNWL